MESLCTGAVYKGRAVQRYGMHTHIKLHGWLKSFLSYLSYCDLEDWDRGQTGSLK